MKSENQLHNVIDSYLAQFPENVREMMSELRLIIKKVVPEATEKISWGMPTFVLKKNLVHFAGHKKHIGLYPGALAIEVFKDELVQFKTSKGAIQFPYDKPLPREIIERILEFCVAENLKS